MTERSWKIFRILTCVIAVATLLFDWRMTLGFLLGTGEAYLQYHRTEKFWNGVVDTGSASRGTGYFHFLINYAIMGITLIACALLPKILNIFACAVGMFMIKITSVVEVLVYKTEKG